MLEAIEKLNQRAALLAREGVERGIASLETSLKIKLDNVPDDQKNYFKEQRKDERAALDQLVALRAALNKRAFDAYLEEK